MSIIGDWYDENYVQPMTKQIKEQKNLLEDCLDLLKQTKFARELTDEKRKDLIKKIELKLKKE